VQTALMNVRFEGHIGHDADGTRCLLLTQSGHSGSAFKAALHAISSISTKLAAKARGVKLGRNGSERLAPLYGSAAIQFARALMPVLLVSACFPVSREITANWCMKRHAKPLGLGAGIGPVQPPRISCILLN
jgi:hypothetical protein